MNFSDKDLARMGLVGGVGCFAQESKAGVM